MTRRLPAVLATPARPLRLRAVVLALVSALAVVLAFAPTRALRAGPGDGDAQDQAAQPDLDARIEALRRLPPAERERLKQALRRFRELPADKREALRQKARKVGEDRLRALGGRDLTPLKQRFEHLRDDEQHLERLVHFERSTEGLSDDERRYLHHELTRGFEQFVKRQFLSPAGTPFDFRRVAAMSPEDRRAYYRQRIEEWLVTDLAPEELAAYKLATPQEQGRTRQRAVRAFRERMTLRYAATFQENVLSRFRQLDPEQRARRVSRFAARARWYEMSRLLETDLKVDPEVLRMLRQLPAEEWTAVRDRYEETRDEPEHRRRLAVEELIREVHGRSVLDRRPRLRGEGVRRRERKDGGAGSGEKSQDAK